MFAITCANGFHLTFKNGVTLSTQFGCGAQCSRHDMVICTEPQISNLDSHDAEIAIWSGDGEGLIRLAYKEIYGEELGDDGKGYVEIEEWLKILEWCRSYVPKEKEEGEGND